MDNPQDKTAETKEMPKRNFPVVPTTKILAIGQFTKPPTPEQIKEFFPKDEILQGDILIIYYEYCRKGISVDLVAPAEMAVKKEYGISPFPTIWPILHLHYLFPFIYHLFFVP